MPKKESLPPKLKTLNGHKRATEAKQIAVENAKILRRLQDTESQYTHTNKRDKLRMKYFNKKVNYKNYMRANET